MIIFIILECYTQHTPVLGDIVIIYAKFLSKQSAQEFIYSFMNFHAELLIIITSASPMTQNGGISTPKCGTREQGKKKGKYIQGIPVFFGKLGTFLP